MRVVCTTAIQFVCVCVCVCLYTHIELPGADDNDEDRDGCDYGAEEDESDNQPEHMRELEAVVTTVATQLEDTGKRPCGHHMTIM